MAKPDLSFNWTTTPVDEDHPIEQDIAQDDTTPTIIQQAELQGWKAGYYHFGKLEDQGTDYFNPAIIERPDGPWLITRASGFHEQGFMYGQNAIIAFKLDDECIQPHHGKILRWPVDNPKQHFEDPRAFYFPEIDQTIIGCCTFLWNGPGDWSGPHQCFGTFDSEWNCKKMDYPLVGGNPGTMEKILEHKNYEKNWCWFLHENKLHLLYKANPWLVVGFNDRWSDRTEYKGEPVSWGNGEIRGGTAPVRVGDYYFTFHHSSLPWKGRYRRYYAGCLAFEAKPPFLPKLITYQPLLQGSQNDPWAQHKPLVIFPCGAIFRNDTWIVSCGVNDLKAAWIQIPHQDLLRRMQPIGHDNSFIFERSGLTPEEKDKLRKQIPSVSKLSEERLAKLRENAAKARAARAAKRLAANGAQGEPETGSVRDDVSSGVPLETRNQPSRKRRRRRFKRITADARIKALKEFEAQKNLASLKEE